MQMTITLLVFLFMIVSFSLHKLPMALTSIVGMLVLVVTGCVDSKTALGNMGSNTVIIVTHNSLIAETADVVIRLKNGRVVNVTENPSPKDIDEVVW